MKIAALILHFSGLAGHEVIYHETLKNMGKTINVTYDIFSNKDPNLPNNFCPFFSQKTFFFRRFYEFFYIFRKDFDIFFIESFTGSEAMAFLLAALFSLQKKTFWLLYRDDLEHQGTKKFVTICLLQCFAFLKKKRFLLLTDSSLVAHYFHKKKFSIKILPNMHAYDVGCQPFTTFTPPFMCWWPGAPRENKGAAEIAHLLKYHDHPDFIMMIADEFRLPSSKMRIRQIPSQLSRKQYLAYLKMSHFILLPYDAKNYRVRTSGIFVEAILAGKIPLVKEGTWLSHELKQFQLDELIVDWNGPLFFEKIRKINIPYLLPRLFSLQKIYQKENERQAFLSILKT